MRVIIDANLYLRMLLPSDNPFRAVAVILAAGQDRIFTMLLPPDLIAEIVDKAASKPSLRKHIRRERVETFVGLLEQSGEVLPRLSGPFQAMCRDPDDDYLLAYAASSNADFLVSGDEDVLALDRVQFDFAIVDPASFLNVLRQCGLIPAQ